MQERAHNWTIFPLNMEKTQWESHLSAQGALRTQSGNNTEKEPWVYRYESQDHGSAEMTKVDRGKNQDTVQNGRVTRQKQNERYRKNIYPLKNSPMVRVEVVT